MAQVAPSDPLAAPAPPAPVAPPAPAAARPRRRSRFRRAQAVEGYLCVLPWLIGFLCFSAGPVIASLVLSFASWDVLTPPEWAGLDNFRRLAADPLFRTALANTAFISLFSVPLQLCLALAVALGLNQKLRGVNLYRTVFYLPSQMPLVASALLWLWIYNPEFGLANALLHLLGLPPLKWLFDVNLAKPSIVLITLWSGIGTAMIIFLAGLQNVPQALYESAGIDGAGAWARFRHITLPMLSPVIFFNLIIGTIASFQAHFTLVYVTTGGGPANATLIYVLYLFYKAFQDFEMGYASALAWVLFVVVALLTAGQFALARSWVHYEGGDRT
jgi:multiple sugar transport system permease protein